jgi:hypothetical protein
MKRSHVNIQACVVTVIFTMLAPRLARGDGGIVRLHEAQGPFSVTVFASPETARSGLADVSVLVQWRNNAEVVLDADVSLAIDPPGGLAMPRSDPLCGLSPTTAAFQLPENRQHQTTVRATREQASNKLLYAATLDLNATGDWRLHVYVLRGSDSARFDCLLPVTAKSAKPVRPWPYLMLPPILITLFAMNQMLRRHSLENSFESQSDVKGGLAALCPPRPEAPGGAQGTARATCDSCRVDSPKRYYAEVYETKRGSS